MEQFEPPRSFFVLGTPRSRTAWLAEFLSVPGRPCQHQPTRHCRSLDDVHRLVQAPAAAIADSVLTFRWRAIAAIAPTPRIVVVRRPLEEVAMAHARIGMDHPGLPDVLRAVSAEIDALLREVPALAVPFAALDSRDTCGEVFRFCHGYEMPKGRWESLARRNIQAEAPLVVAAQLAEGAGFYSVFPELMVA